MIRTSGVHSMFPSTSTFFGREMMNQWLAGGSFWCFIILDIFACYYLFQSGLPVDPPLPNICILLSIYDHFMSILCHHEALVEIRWTEF